MLSDKQVIATLAVKNLKTAAQFYEGKLGFEPVGREGDDLVTYRSGQSVFNVYRSQYAGSNQATALCWMVGDELLGLVRTLRAKGIAFEHYDMPGMTRDGDIHLGGDMKTAWFKDPDGNILNIVSR
jgi:catechol 2,3-dioxygenase-like lactoylglutathione lyase family enzyme